MTKPLIVVTAGTGSRQHERAVAQVLSTVGAAADVMTASARSGGLPVKLARRVRRLPGRTAAEVAASLAETTYSDRAVVVVHPGVRLTAGWLTQVLVAAGKNPTEVGVHGSPEPRLEVYPAEVRTTDAARCPLTGIDLVSGGEEQPVTISASLIVKDEAEVIAKCLDALHAYVDEIVVYDTGSSDDTVAIARSHGARVVEGYWNDHFGDARNRSLEECTGTWVLAVDADEVVTGDAAQLRASLRHQRQDVVDIAIINTTWSGGTAGSVHRAGRLFRRDRCTWTGALHEYLIAIPGTPPLVRSQITAPVSLLHSGYQATTVSEKSKGERNIAISRAAVDALTEGDPDTCVVWCNYGRSLAHAGRDEEALAALTVVRENPTEPASVLLAARSAVQCLILAGRWAEAEDWIAVAEKYGEAAGMLSLWRAHVAKGQGDPAGAEAFAERAVRSVDLWGVEFDPDRAVVVRSELLLARGEGAVALELLLDLRRRAPESAPLAAMLRTADALGTPYGDIAEAMGEAGVERSLREAAGLQPGAAHLWCEALWERRRDRRAVVAGSVVARRMSMREVLLWALRAREAGLAEHCPLRAIAADENLPAGQRAVATAVLAEVLLEPDAVAALGARLGAVPDDEHEEVLEALATYAPALASQVVAA